MGVAHRVLRECPSCSRGSSQDATRRWLPCRTAAKRRSPLPFPRMPRSSPTGVAGGALWPVVATANSRCFSRRPLNARRSPTRVRTRCRRRAQSRRRGTASSSPGGAGPHGVQPVVSSDVGRRPRLPSVSDVAHAGADARAAAQRGDCRQLGAAPILVRRQPSGQLVPPPIREVRGAAPILADYPLEKLPGKVRAAPHPTGHSPGHLLPRGEKGRQSLAT
jgi:hypothetical protein